MANDERPASVRDRAALLAEARALLAELPQPEPPSRQRRSQSPDGEPALAELTQRAESVAAVSGALEPSALLASVGVASADELGQRLLNALAPLFNVDVQAGKTLWSMLPEPRAQILDEVIKAPIDFASLPATDEFGSMLRRVLDPDDHLSEEAVNDLTPDQLLALVAATEALPASHIDKPDLDALYARVARERLDNSDRVLLSNFVGRHAELEQLRHFLAKPLARDWAGLLVTGLGGAGKSTLVAKFVSEVRRHKLATVVVLDFDRPGIDPRDSQWLEAELARQVGMDHPVLEASLRRAREHAWQHRLQASAEQTYTSEAREMDRSRVLLDEVRQALQALTPPCPALLLVLDTFEEVTQLKLEGKLMDWLVEAADRLHPLPVKVIISGRLFDFTTTLGSALLEKAPLHLDQLQNEFAVELLRREVVTSSAGRVEMPQQYARALVEEDLFPRRPLELKLVARLYVDSPDEVAALKSDLRTGGERLRGLFAGLVYRRILMRMTGASDSVKQLAFPGLVLRYVTPTLIQQVLVPCLGMPAMSDEAAVQALDILASYSWFAEREPTGALRYRRDLRRATLKVARAEEAEKTRGIHRKAIEWFEAPEGRQPAEALYHRLMLGELDGFDATQLAELVRQAKAIRTDIEDLPPLGEALLLFAIGEQLRPEQIALLPSPQREEGYRRKGSIGAQAGEYGLALAMHQRFRRAGGTRAPELEQWEVETLFATAAWRDLADRRSPRLAQPSEWRAFVTDVFTGAVLESLGLAELDGISVERRVLDEIAHRPADVSRTDLTRVAFALVLRDDRPRAPAWQMLLDASSRLAKSDVGTQSTGQWAGRLTLFRMLRRERGAWPSVLLGIPISLDPSHHQTLLELGQSLVPPVELERLRTFVQDIALVVQQGVRGRWTARSILAAINSRAGFAPTCLEGLKLRAGDDRILAPAHVQPVEALGRVAAVDPEFRDPVRFALREAFADDQEQLRQLLVSVVPFQLDDLDPGSFASELSADVEHALSTHIELIDRCGATGQLLLRACEQRPQAEKLSLVARAHAEWRAALRRLFEFSDTTQPKKDQA